VYNSVLFTQQRMGDLLEQLGLVLEQAAKNPLASVGSLSLVTPQAKSLLPNPTSNLGWASFEGPITEIFAKQAQQYPDRVCVVESLCSPADGEHPTRSFSYEQLNRASNVLAHHLLRGGIQREDVVVLYSHRGVDLVVAIMGVLKAGATFSVIGTRFTF
jgi:L-aminoadipate-semialdehyde dehydrogenase